MKEKKSKLFLVLCLHRSGSSATAGMMHLLGIHMGEQLLPSSLSNPKGHYENAEFVSINQEILQSVNSTWYKPPRKKIKAAHFPASKIRTFIAKHVKPVWGIKDPRTLLTFEVWKPYLEEAADITYIFVHRPFEESVRSLVHRDGISIGRARKILTPYLKNHLYYRHSFGLPAENIIDVYYQDMLNHPELVVRKLNQKIGNAPDFRINEAKKFLDIKLKNF